MSGWKQYIAPAAIVWLSPAACYAAQYLSVQEAQHQCFPNATEFQEANVVFTPEQITEIESQSGQKILTKAQQIWKAVEGDKVLGFFVVDYVIGKHLVIDYSIAINLDKTVKQVEILQYRESYGDEIRNPDWLRQFAGKTKDSSLELNDDIVNIGGATLSSRHVTEGIKRILATINVVEK